MRRNRLAVVALTVGSMVAVVAPVAPAVATTVSLASIDATGVRDVSREMAAYLASRPDHSVVRLVPGGRYRMEKTLLIRNRHRLLIDGNGATIFATTAGNATRAHVRIERSSRIVIRDLNVRGVNPHAGTSEAAYQPAFEHQHGFDVRSSSAVKLLNVSVRDTYGDFVYLGQAEDGPWSQNIVIRGGHFERNGRQGVALIGVRNVFIERNYFGQMRRATFDFEPRAPGAGVDGVTIRNNRIGPGRLLFVAADGDGPVHRVSVTGNRLSGQSIQVFVHHGLHGRRDRWRIAGNVSDAVLGNPHGSAMRFWRVNGLTVTGNSQTFQAGRNMVVAEITRSCGVTVSGNVRPGSVGEVAVEGTC